ncbi:MAG: hypothetical protein CM1200mP18_19140 [Gammaproteobacteria bacterium]|nr:MAG: hypothetical protein CM1200mP18_19140 [Gammaproteobacteria bacterium]
MHRVRRFNETQDVRDVRRTTISSDGPTTAQVYKLMNKNHPPLLGYADQCPPDQVRAVEVKVSSYLEGEYTARLVRTICADPNPEGMGLLEEAIDCSFAGSYAARVQPFTPGSCVKVPLTEDISCRTHLR